MPIDYSKYPPDWHTRIRPEVIARAGNCCEGSPKHPDCRVPNYSKHPETGSKVILTVAHMDHNIQNNDLKNLRALCQRCHLNHDREQHNRSRAYGKEHRDNQMLLFPEEEVRPVFLPDDQE